MLRPPTISVANYPVATKPLLGFEQQMYVCVEPFTDLGLLNIGALNSGTYTAQTADNAQLAVTPQKLLCICETTGITNPSGALIVQVIGTDAAGAALSGVATFTPPGYAQSQAFDVGQRRAVEVIPWQAGVVADTAKFKTISAVNVLQADAGYLYADFRVAGFPDVSQFTKIGTKVNFEMDPKIQEPVAIQDGKDRGRYVKPGEIPVGTANISTKDAVSADGLRRYNGQTVTGLVIEKKQDRITTLHTFLGGLIMTAKPRGGEGQDAVMLEATAMYQTGGIVLAQ